MVIQKAGDVVFNVRSRKGKVVRIVRERYLRDGWECAFPTPNFFALEESEIEVSLQIRNREFAHSSSNSP